MGHKIFVSYKYADSNVHPLNTYRDANGECYVHNYVSMFEDVLRHKGGNIYMGEKQGEDLSHLAESTIRNKLYDKIYYTTVTVVFISPNMREFWKPQDKQWIPQEISYSLRLSPRNGRVSGRNALICVVLPDKNNSYTYFHEDACFDIIKANLKNGYAKLVHWNVFIHTIDNCVEDALFLKGFHEDEVVVTI